MTKEAVRTLKNGDRVHWIENDEYADGIGVVNQDKSQIEWPDDQVTLFSDDWAMARVFLVNPLNPDPKHHNSLNLG